MAKPVRIQAIPIALVFAALSVSRPLPLPVPHAPAAASISYGAWGAGYQADAPKGQRFTEVLAEFIAPKYAPPPPVSGVSWMGVWGGIGLGATPTNDLMQDGIFEGMQPGVFGYSIMAPWWINEPSTPPTEPHVLYSLTIRPGDTVLSIAKQAGPRAWSFDVEDVTTGQKASGSCTDCYTGGHTVAWILEDPMSGSTLAQTNYADPATVVFLKAEASLGHGLVPLGKLNWHPVLREATGQVEKPAAAPAKDGAFTIKRFDVPAAKG